MSSLALVAAGLVVSTSQSPAYAAQTVSNIAYAPAQPAGSRGHLLDLYLPGGTARTPLAIWTSGSAWTSDDGKSGASAIASAFNARGYAVAGVSVRSSSQAKFPAQVHDIKAAIRWLRANADRYNLDPTRFAVLGDSSGGWEADMATLTGGVASLEGTLGTTGVSSTVQAGVSFFGPTDFLQMNAQRVDNTFDHDAASSPASQIMGCAIQTCPEQVRLANPITYVDRADPPMLLLHGTADQIVPHGQSVLLYDALKAACVSTRFFSVPGANHGTNDVMSPSRYGQQTVRTSTSCGETTSVGSPNPSWDTVISWLDDALKAGGPNPTPTPTSPTPTPTTPTPTPTSNPGAGCTASVRITSSWPGGWVADVSVTAGSARIDGWTVSLTLPGGSSVTNLWNGVVTGTSGTVTVRNQTWNGHVDAGRSTTFGFQGAGSSPSAGATCVPA
ncbi:cellulose binding domain-containing protein [Cellulomonas sp.]|uniref:cellulose binding domain-containing protein n=1 Tax=Cellulomonas sp. TaxID=40001 RepID=UPI001B1CB439|nr:cellulose binding domain-containing protein [Cellulomonas sp.]MBO9554637.1 cellulose binding domain-containing protein [Cellulomonas sp.]